MTIAEFKTKIGVSSLPFARQLAEEADAQGVHQPTEWLRFWDNDKRIAVVMHQDIMQTIAEDLNFNNLAVKSEKKNTDKGPYMNYILIIPKSTEVVF